MARVLPERWLVLGYRGGVIADLSAIEDLLHRVSRMSDDLPELADLELNPVLVATAGLAVVNASASIAPSDPRSDWYTRRLG